LETDTLPGAETLLGALSEPAMILAGGIVLAANPAARKALGESLVGEDARRAIPDGAAVERLLVPSSAAIDDVELSGVGEPGRRWLMSARRLGPATLLVRLFDRSEAYAAEKMRVDFVANASHELRTPLATLVGYAETLREEANALDDPTRERFTAIVHDEARRMQRLVEDLISLSRIEAERFSPPRGALSLARLIEQAREGFRRAAEERGSQIVAEVEPDIPPVRGDSGELAQLLDNLLSNALRYGRRGTPVTVRAAAEEGRMVRLSIADEGDGIPAKHLPRITQRFYRVDASRSRALGGTGLGLSIVKHIVERHRGRLVIESEVGRGTTVHVLLPAAPGNGR
jgi:two-component system phosphate regulon sensor histidine kinase PhoR